MAMTSVSTMPSVCSMNTSCKSARRRSSGSIQPSRLGVICGISARRMMWAGRGMVTARRRGLLNTNQSGRLFSLSHSQKTELNCASEFVAVIATARRGIARGVC